TDFWFSRVAAGRADGERDEAAPRQLQSEIPVRLLRVESRASFRLVIHDEYGRKGAGAFRHHQPAFPGLLRCYFQANAMLREVITAPLAENLHLGFFQNSRPRAHQVVPGSLDLSSSRRPIARRS